MRRFLFKKPDSCPATGPAGYASWHNARAGLVAGLHGPDADAPARTMQYFRNATTAFMSVYGAAGSDDQAQASLDSQRFDRSWPSRVRDDVLPKPYRDVPNLEGARVASIIPLADLHRIMSQDDKNKIQKIVGAPFPQNNHNISERYAKNLRKLDASHRKFSMQNEDSGGNIVYIKQFILWFTSEIELEGLRVNWSGSGDEAQRIRDLLGLIHFTPDTWLIALTFDGRVAQRVGHWRPLFCDARGNPRFMLLCSNGEDRIRPASPWGQTADLDRLDRGKGTCDGLPERVMHTACNDDFANEMITFEVLGRVNAQRGTAPYGSHGAFASRLVQNNR
jgi:hypothetical protein